MSKRGFKGIICGLLFTTIIGSAVYAGTGSAVEEYAYEKNVSKQFIGSGGVYTGTAGEQYVQSSVTSTSSSSRLYKVEVKWKCNLAGYVCDFEADSEIMSRYQVLSVSIGRDSDMVQFSYVTNGKAYNSISEATGIADDYTYTIYQNVN